MRLSDKNIVQRIQTLNPGLPADFYDEDFKGSVKTKGYKVIHEKAYLCPCKSKESDHRSTCKNCGGTGYLYCNPTSTRMIISGILSDGKFKEAALKEWGLMDTGSVKITADPSDKLSFMDRITITNATSEHQMILYSRLTDDESQRFAFTKYNIKAIDFIGIFQSETEKIKRLSEPTDYTFRDNIILLDSQYLNNDSAITIRYVHSPQFHVTDVIRESMTSLINNGTEETILPVHAIGKRAHLIQEAENFNGDRLLDNSWLPNQCEVETFSAFKRQLRLKSAQEIYDSLTPNQLAELNSLINT
jgi:hypothetical protein